VQSGTTQQNSRGRRASQWRSALVFCLIAIALAMLVVPSGESNVHPNDFAFYWTAAKLVLEGRNPYSHAETLDLQRRLSFPGKGHLVMLNPPWVLPLVAPVGLLSFAMGRSLWLLIGLALVFISVHWLWDLYGAGGNRWIGWLVAVTFLPVAVVLAIGQIGPLILFGLAGYLRFEARHHYYVAGIFLFLAALKPHLVFLLWIALLLCALYQRRWQSLAAFLATLAVASFLTVLVDHRVFQQYAGLVGGEKVVFQETPTLGGLLRHISGFSPLQFLPIGVAVIWFAVYWVRWRSSWEWQDRLPSLLLVSMATTSYAWFFDQVVLLPSMFYATMMVLRSRRFKSFAAVTAYLAINCLVLLLLLDHRTTFWYSWTALAWLALYAVVQQGVTDDISSVNPQ
jgi:glycosyl transferase family 87